jgi:CheY-like chemotaxis protein/two-component sensor histidine kinase
MDTVGRLAGGVAHDFNNLLTVILNGAELALQALRADDPLRTDLVEIHGAAERAAALTRQLLAFSRRQMLRLEVLNLNTTLADMEKMLPRVLGEDIELVVARGEDLWNVRADPGQLAQIVMNLAVNSRDAMPAGGMLSMETANVEFDAAYTRTHPDVTPGGYVMLAVTDTGVGMDEATRQRIFEPFFTTKALGQGTGLGLSTVYGIVKQTGGHIVVSSEIGRGTTFRIYFPRVAEPVARATRVRAAEPARGSETILVVEDEPGVRKLAKRILEMVGYTALEAENAGEAQSVVQRHGGAIQLLLTDVVMPGMSGPELAMRLVAERPELKVLYMSGYTESAITQQRLLGQGTAFIAKPFDASVLTRRVREVLDS